MDARIAWSGVLLLAALAAAHAPRATAQSGDTNPRTAFAQSCGACHGSDGAGTAAGPSLAASPLTLADFTTTVRRGQRTMPAYGADALPDQRLAEIYDFLQSQPARDFATGRPDAGARLFAEYGCYYCHGNEAQGGVAGPRLGPAPITFARFEWYVRQPSREMPPYSTAVVSAEELADIYAFLAARPRPPPLESIPLLAP